MCSKPQESLCPPNYVLIQDLCHMFKDGNDNISNENRRLGNGQIDELNEDIDACISRKITIKKVRFGEYTMKTQYFSPYPKQFQNLNKILICKYCLTYHCTRERSYEKHMDRCEYKHPPGLEIYRKNYQSGNISIWELNPSQNNILYCRYLCLLARLFLGDKQILYNIEPFLFYVLCKTDENNLDHMIGFFSKEKDPYNSNNVACIMVLPAFQKNSYGNFLIDVSYFLSKKEKRIAGPEEPLSEDGKRAYVSYWSKILAKYFIESNEKMLSIKNISEITSIRERDLHTALRWLKCRRRWESSDTVCISQHLRQRLLNNVNLFKYSEPKILLDPEVLNWTPTEYYTQDRIERLYHQAKLRRHQKIAEGQIDENHFDERPLWRKDEDNLNPNVSIGLSVKIQSDNTAPKKKRKRNTLII